MLIELNGLSFHLRIATAGRIGIAEASIVDEAFQYPVMKRPVFGASCVYTLIEDYTGFKPTRSLMATLTCLLSQKRDQAA